MARTRRFAAIVALAVLPLAGCTNTDADEGDVVDAMEDAGLPRGQAECVGERFVEEFDDQDTLNDLASADDPQDFPSGTEEQVTQILEECTSGASAGSGDTGEPGEDTTESTEATTTTAG